MMKWIVVLECFGELCVPYSEFPRALPEKELMEWWITSPWESGYQFVFFQAGSLFMIVDQVPGWLCALIPGVGIMWFHEDTAARRIAQHPDMDEAVLFPKKGNLSRDEDLAYL